MSEYTIINGQLVSVDELKHYGVKGMKWGVRKSEYKAMNRQQRKETRKAYYNTPEGKTVKATSIGTFFGGPLVGVLAGLITAKKVGYISQSTIDKGKRKVEEVKDRDFKELSQKAYEKFYADDVEGIVKNMSKSQYKDLRKHVGRQMDNGDWDVVEDYVARKYG